MQSEGLTLERRPLDLEAGTLRLDPGTTKNDEGRIVYLPTELKTALAAQAARVETVRRPTRSVFDRYHIVSPADLKDVARRMTGTIPGTIG